MRQSAFAVADILHQHIFNQFGVYDWNRIPRKNRFHFISQCHEIRSEIDVVVAKEEKYRQVWIYPTCSVFNLFF